MTQQRSPNRGRKTLTVLVAIVAVAVVTTIGPSNAQQPSSTDHQHQASAALVPLPHDPALQNGVAGLTSTATTGKAHIVVRTPPTYAFLPLIPADSPLGTLPAKSYMLPAHPVPNCDYLYTVFVADAYAMDFSTKDQVVRSFGKFPDTKVSLLAFGSIPVTATLHLQQITSHGRMQPVRLTSIQSYLAYPPDDHSGAANCDVDWATVHEPPTYTLVDGYLTASISNIMVDRRVVPVGNHCQTQQPLHIHLNGVPPGYANNLDGGTITQRLDTARIRSGNSTYPLYPTSQNLDIPPFTGCRNPQTGEDVSRLVTAMVAGGDNALAVTQSTAILNDFTSDNRSVCDPFQGCASLPKAPTPVRPGG